MARRTYPANGHRLCITWYATGWTIRRGNRHCMCRHVAAAHLYPKTFSDRHQCRCLDKSMVTEAPMHWCWRSPRNRYFDSAVCVYVVVRQMTWRDVTLVVLRYVMSAQDIKQGAWRQFIRCHPTRNAECYQNQERPPIIKVHLCVAVIEVELDQYSCELWTSLTMPLLKMKDARKDALMTSSCSICS